MGNSYMKRAFLFASYFSRGWWEYLQQDVLIGLVCSYRVLMSSSR